MSHASVGIIEFDLEGRGVYVNRQWRELTGVDTPAPIPGEVMLGVLHPEDREHVMEQWQRAVKAGGSYEATARVLHRDGQVHTIQSRTEPLFDDGEVTGFVASIVDISASLRDDQLARGDRYRALHEQGSIGQVVLGLDTRILDVNEAFAEMLETRPADLVGRPTLDIVHPEDIEIVAGQLEQLLDGRATFVDEEVRLLRHNGSAVWVAGGASLVRDAHGEARYIQATVFDASDRRRAWAALADSERRYRAVVDSLHEAVLILDDRGLIENANESAFDLVGVTDDGRRPQEQWAELDDLRYCDADGQPLEIADLPSFRCIRSGETTTDFVLGIDGIGGLSRRRWFKLNVRPLDRPSSDRRGAVVSFRDVTREKEADDALRESEARYRALVDTAPIGQVVTDLEGRLVQANDAYGQVMGAPIEELLGTVPADRVHPDDMHMLGEQYTQLLRGDILSFDVEYRTSRADGETIWVRGPVSLVHDETGEAVRVHALVQDIHERRNAEERARQLAAIVESTSDLVGTIDPETGSLLYLNRSARKLFGMGDKDLADVDARHLYTEPAARHWETDVAVSVEMGRTWIGELDMLRADGEVIHVQQSVSADLDSRGAIRQIFFVGRDVTEQRRHEVDLAHQATHDPLTDLPNRAMLLQLVEHALHRAERADGLVALLFLDLDRFKTVNDNLGHDVGDELLVEVARRISETLRPTDTVARLGGDEFVVLCEDVRDEHQAVAITQRITASIEQQAFEVGGAVLPITASVGIALSGDVDAHPEGLLRDADAAMYRAKDRGRARHELFDDEMRRRTTHRLSLADELAVGIERGQISVHYQPIIDLTTGRVEGVEALARWDHPTRGTLPPIEFIGLAEETGLIVGLGLSVLSRACDQARRWEVELGNRAPKVHVNLSARQLSAANLPRLVEGVIDQSLIDPERLCLEVTESVLMDDAATSVTVLEELKAIGVELAIDDFGTGYSSLAYLRRFPVDVLKIDRSFVDGLGPDPDDSAIVSVIVGLAQTLGLGCVAEGVETVEQLSGLRSLGCELAQGYYFARPHPVPDVNRYLTTTFQVNGTHSQ
jgi:diguanylate cyclase (GGDEF)-like protein/PAS domain S-box-containing protein